MAGRGESHIIHAIFPVSPVFVLDEGSPAQARIGFERSPELAALLERNPIGFEVVLDLLLQVVLIVGKLIEIIADHVRDLQRQPRRIERREIRLWDVFRIAAHGVLNDSDEIIVETRPLRVIPIIEQPVTEDVDRAVILVCEKFGEGEDRHAIRAAPVNPEKNMVRRKNEFRRGFGREGAARHAFPLFDQPLSNRREK